jgi:hypothetical protein
MLDFIDTPSDVLALTISKTITGEDLDRCMDRLDRALQENDKLHIFVETRGIDGIELSGLPSYTARAMPLFGKLKRFGRVAVVADQAWVRFGTRLESMVLPFISYRVFEPTERAEALDWVIGGQASAAQ